MNQLSYTEIDYLANQWYRIDVLLDWDDEEAAYFLDGHFVSNTLFYSYERDR